MENLDWNDMYRRLAAAREGLAREFQPGAAESERRLRERALALARKPAEPEDAADLLSLLEFTLGGLTYALEGHWIREVAADILITPVPCTPSFLTGIFYLRGLVVPVVDFPALMGLTSKATLEAAHIVILTQGERCLGLMADTIVGMAPVRRDKLDPIPATVQKGRQFFQGVIDTGTIVLDGGTFFDDQENGFAQAGLG